MRAHLERAHLEIRTIYRSAPLSRSIHIYIYTYTYIYTCIYTSPMQIYICTSQQHLVRAHLERAHLEIRTIYRFAPLNRSIHTYIYLYIHIHMYIHVHVHAVGCVQGVSRYVYVLIHTLCIYTYIVHIYIHCAYIHTLCIYTYIHLIHI